MLLNSSPWYILIWKTGWGVSTLPAKNKQPEGFGRGWGEHSGLWAFLFSLVGAAAPDVYCSSWPLLCAPACCVWAMPGPIMGKPGWDRLCLFLDLMAQSLLKAVGLHTRGGLPVVGSAPLCGPISPCTHAPALRGFGVGPVSAPAFPAAPRCFPRKKSLWVNLQSGTTGTVPSRNSSKLVAYWWHSFLSSNAEADSLLFLYCLGPLCHFQKEVA